MHKNCKKGSVSWKENRKYIHSSTCYLSCFTSVPCKVRYGHSFLTSSRGHRTSLSINLFFDVQHQQQLKKSVLAVLIVCAELGLLVSCDGCPDSTQHATSGTASLDRFKYSVTNELSQTPPGLSDEIQTNEVDCIISTPPSLRAVPSYISAWTDGVRVMCGGSSPYSTVHQVIPGGHVE